MERHIILPLPGLPLYFLANVGEGEEREKQPECDGFVCCLGSATPGLTWSLVVGREPSDTWREKEVFRLAPPPPLSCA